MYDSGHVDDGTRAAAVLPREPRSQGIPKTSSPSSVAAPAPVIVVAAPAAPSTVMAAAPVALFAPAPVVVTLHQPLVGPVARIVTPRASFTPVAGPHPRRPAPLRLLPTARSPGPLIILPVPVASDPHMGTAGPGGPNLDPRPRRGLRGDPDAEVPEFHPDLGGRRRWNEQRQ